MLGVARRKSEPPIPRTEHDREIRSLRERIAEIKARLTELEPVIAAQGPGSYRLQELLTERKTLLTLVRLDETRLAALLHPPAPTAEEVEGRDVFKGAK